jgi:Ca-activated chloride channel family protein
LWLNPDQRGMRALQRDDAARAAELFEDPAWAGTAAYRNGDYEAAAGHFSSADSADADSWYNRGNALARAGQLDEAIAAYQRSLALQPGATDAAANLELLEQLKQQQEQQQGEGEDGQQDQGGQDSAGDGQQQPGEAGTPEQEPTGDESRSQPPAQQDPSQNTPGAADEPADDASRPPAASDEQQDNGERDAPQQDLTVPELSLEEAERDQAMELWLRRVPDDPSGLLREKFRYQSRQRQQQQPRSNNEPEW